MLSYKIFKGFQVLLKFRYPFIGGRISGVWLSSDKLVVDLYHPLFLQGFKMAGKLSVSYVQSIFKTVKIIAWVNHQDRHYSQSYPAFKNLVYV